MRTLAVLMGVAMASVELLQDARGFVRREEEAKHDGELAHRHEHERRQPEDPVPNTCGSCLAQS
jgi:hypothetical protein